MVVLTALPGWAGSPAVGSAGASVVFTYGAAVTAGTEVQVLSGIYVGAELATSAQTGTYVVTASAPGLAADSESFADRGRATCSWGPTDPRALWSRRAGSSVHGVARPGADHAEQAGQLGEVGRREPMGLEDREFSPRSPFDDGATGRGDGGQDDPAVGLAT